MPKIKENEDLNKKYKINCPYCGEVQYARRSLAHLWGISDAGHGNCLKCKGFMKLIYNSERDIMIAEEWKIRSK